MCGILANFNYNGIIDKKHIKLIENRGLDNFGITDFKDIKHFFKLSRLDLFESNFIFHNLHSMTDLFKQPVNKKNYYFAANCEIYNYKELNPNANNDTSVLFNLIVDKLIEIEHDEEYKDKALTIIQNELKKIDGIYSFIIYNKLKNIVFIAKDPLGVKSLKYYIKNNELLICSESKVIKEILKDDNRQEENIINLDGNNIILFDLNDSSIKQREIEDQLFILPNNYENNKDVILKKLDELIPASIEKRVPNKKFGVLFSGGIDSTLIVSILKEKGYDFICYSACFMDGNTQKSPDIIKAEEICKKLNIEFKYEIIDLKTLSNEIKTVAKIIEDMDVIKLGVALPFYFASKLAIKDNIKVLFSGLGSEELFAGYNRHLEILNKKEDVNKECLDGLQKIQFKDLYRDDLIMMSNNIELRLPFLDKQLVKYSLNISPELKINNEQKKIILREYSKKYNIDPEIIERKKLGAQYGSNFDKGIEKLKKLNNLKYKDEYIKHIKANIS